MGINTFPKSLEELIMRTFMSFHTVKFTEVIMRMKKFIKQAKIFNNVKSSMQYSAGKVISGPSPALSLMKIGVRPGSQDQVRP